MDLESNPFASVSANPRTLAPLTLLPRGRVEAVFIVDPAQRPRGNEWRVSFDFDRFALGEAGVELEEKRWMPRVQHVLATLLAVMMELAKRGCRPVYVGKADDDHIRVFLWKSDRNTVDRVVRLLGWPVELVEIPWGQQCPQGFDSKLSLVKDIAAFMPRGMEALG